MFYVARTADEDDELICQLDDGVVWLPQILFALYVLIHLELIARIHSLSQALEVSG